MKRTDKQRHHKAFTLIELLVVIAVISILAAILFPVFARARENARRASCMSNMKQITLGMLQYTQDYDGHFPMYRVAALSSHKTAKPYGWAEALQPYIKSAQIFQCPSESTSPDTSELPAETASAYTDYGYNIWIGGFYKVSGSSRKGIGLSQAALTSPTLTVVLVDYHTAGSANHVASTNLINGRVNSSWLNPRHLDGINLAFTDGHVKWYHGNNQYNRFRNLWEAGTPGSVSGNDPTLNPAPDAATSILSK